MDAAEAPDAFAPPDAFMRLDAFTAPDAPRCGDGALSAGEACDDGAANSDTQADACRTDCTEHRCGDGVTDTAEECDDGAANDDGTPDVCRTDCSAPRCGDGVTDTGEACDDGAANSDAAVDVRDTGEWCDDGNVVGGDTCPADCRASGARAWDPATTTDPGIELSNGNLTISGTNPTCAYDGVVTPRATATGRWYFEHTALRDGGSSDTRCPVAIGIESLDGATRVAWYGYHGSMTTLSLGTYACAPTGEIYVDSGDVIGVAWDADAGTVAYTLDGVPTFTCTVPAGTYLPFGSHCNDSIHHCSGTTNFGDTAFAFGPPDGYLPLP